MSSNPLEQLEGLKSWQLHKISPSTFPSDIAVTLSRTGQYAAVEIESIIQMLRGNGGYRFRIGKARYYFGTTAEEAIQAALKGAVKEKPASDE